MFVLEEFSGPDPILVGRLHTDLDVGSRNIKYVLAGEGAGTIFAINELTGDIHAMKRLDREEKAEYTLTAQVINADTDEPLEPPSEFIIKVQDINDNPPQFIEGPYRASVPEMSAVATIKIALHGMDREMREEYLVVIQAKDMGGHMGGLSGTTTVTVTLTDINDNPPKFSKSLYDFIIPEDLPIGKMGGKVKANDRDIGENAKSTYSVIEGDEQGVFEIVTDTQTQEGILRLKKPLDFETKRAYTLKVEATNIRSEPSGGLPYKDTATVKVVVEDSDEPPVFSKPMYSLEVNENAPINTVIGTVTARDPDSSGSVVRYFIDRHTDLERQFNINVDDGKITLAKTLDRETDMWHNITVTATEVSNQISRAIVAIRVMDINDNAPEFATEYEAFLCENGKPGQVIQTVSAVDKDDPIQGHYFDYRLVPEMLNNPNFTIKNNQDNSISVLAKHDTFRRQKQEMYFLPIIVTDNGNPPMSSTNTLTIRVCGCSKDGIVQSCNVEAYVLPIGLSMGALIAILACIILLLVIVVLFVTLRRHKNEPLIIKDDEDVRENIIRYDDEGGGEEDTEAFDIATLQNPDGINGYLPRKDIKPDLQFMPRAGQHSGPNGVDVDEFINVRLHEADNDPTAPPYDSIQIYGYEGRGSIAGSLSSLETASSDSDQNYDYLREWGPRFRRLGELYSVGESDRET
ncbi:cadherin-8 isoform X4 [Scomber japonicus]|uniref:cadherin-8 isoform X4 n=1 Tax=Scomber japonicus TaxID=13676 RepID=UPI002305C516|nr:cadherin-8 isoform X4 [Scomber japonicus]